MLTEKPFDTGELVINFAEGETAGPPLVLLHGSTGDWHAFDEFISTLELGWHLYACDLRGHGKSDRARSGYLYENFVSDTVAFIERQVGKPVVLAGYSLGASIALGVAARLPGLVRALVLFDPALSFYRDSGLEAFPGPHGWYTWLNQVLATPHSLEEIAARMKETWPENDDATALGMAQVIHHLDHRSVVAMLNDQTFQAYKPEHLLTQLVCPTLLVRGELTLGSVINQEDVELFQRSVPHGITVRIKDAGHDVMWGPLGQAALEHVVRFLNSL